MPVSTEELGRLEYRFTAQGDQYLKTLKEIQQETHKTHTMMEQLAHRAGHFGKEFAGDVANRLLGGMGLGGLAAGLAAGSIHLVEHSIEMAEKYEKVNIGLTAVLEANGRKVAEVREQYQQYANELRRTTDLTALQATNLLRLAESYGLSGEAAKRAVTDAAALEAVTGHSAEAMLRVTHAVEEGNLKQAMSYGRLIPQLRGVTDREEYLVKLNKLVDAGNKAQAETAQTAGHKWAVFREQVDEASAGLGKFLLKAGERSGAMDWLKTSRWSGIALFSAYQEQEESRRAAGHGGGGASEEDPDGFWAHIKARAQLAKAAAFDTNVLLKKLKEEAETTGLTADEVERYKLAKDGATRADLDYVKSKQAMVGALKEDAKLVEHLEQMNIQLRQIGLTGADKEMVKFRHELEKLEGLSRQSGWFSPATNFAVENLRARLEDFKQVSARIEAATVIEGQREPREKMLEFEDRMYRLLEKRLLTQEQVNRALEAERAKLYGVMAAARSAESVFGGANAARRFSDYFVARNDADLSPRGGARAGPGPGVEAARDTGSAARNPGMNPLDDPAGRAKAGEAQAAAVTVLEQMLALMQGGVQLAVVGAD